MSVKNINQFLLLPELKYSKHYFHQRFMIIECDKVSEFEVCPRCAHKSSTIYDRRLVHIRDEPIRNKHVILKIRKRRFKCKNLDCSKKCFTEPVNGIKKGFRTSMNFRSFIRKMAAKYMDLKSVTKDLRVSSSTVYLAFYEQIELELRKSKNNVWPKTIGIDEHSFQRNVKQSGRDFVSVFIDYDNKRMKDVVLGKSIMDLKNSSIKNIPGRERVKNVIVDLSPTFRSFAQSFFPEARLIADHFHVVKLMHPYIQELRKRTIEEHELNKKRGNPARKLVIAYRKKLGMKTRWALDKFLDLNKDLKEVYEYQQKLYRVYRIKGYKRAKKALFSLLDSMAYSRQKKVLSYRRTLLKWRFEILNYFSTNKLNNGRTEGYNCKAKLIQRCAYGFRSFRNYRLKLLYHCR